MANRDPRVDTYISRAAGFAQPILNHLRAVVHETCPEVEETMKWNAPTFMYKGMLCGMAAFKQHCAFGFWKGSLVVDSGDGDGPSAGQFGRIDTLEQLPPRRVLAGYIEKAMRLNEEGVKAQPKSTPRVVAGVEVPDDLTAALARNEAARATFEGFSPSHKREYVEWLTEAKKDETRKRRLETAVQWMSEGRERNWKYVR